MDLKFFPAELKALPQWCAAGAGDPAAKGYKAPINPHTSGWASVTDPKTWGTFEEAVATGYPLVGFVFSASDPYAVIDLDTYKAPNDEVKAMHAEILQHAATYTEISQSGLGTHIICTGRVPEGARNDANAIEVYSQDRFMICTGHTSSVKPITPQQELLDYLFQLLKGRATGHGLDWRDLGRGEEAMLTDLEVIERASNADNGDKFDRLCGGDMSDYSNDHSAADAALIQFLCFYTKDNEQVARIFHMSALGKREKAHRKDYIPRTITRMREKIAADEVPPVDPSEIIARAQAQAHKPAGILTDGGPGDNHYTPSGETGGDPHYRGSDDSRVITTTGGRPEPSESVSPAPAPVMPPVAPATFPPGLVGEIARYILAASTRPVEEAALAGGIALVSGIVGRHYNISTPATGLNQYILYLAKTGTGKEAIQAGIDRLFAEVQKTVPAADRFLGPAAFSSGPALIKQFGERPSFVSVLGEFGHRVKAMTHPRANGADRTLMAALLDLYSKSGWGQMLRSSVYSDKEKNTEIVHAPALTLLGETAPEPFFAGLDEATIETGFLPRFLMIEYTGDRPRRNKQALTSPPADVVKATADLCATVLQMEQNGSCCTLSVDPNGQRVLDEFDEEVDTQMRGSAEVVRQLWNRAHLKALRLASLIAVGVNPYAPVITAEHASWAVNMIRRDVAVLHKRFLAGDVGEGDSKLRADLVSLISRYYEDGNRRFSQFHAKGCVPGRYLAQATAARAAFRNDRRGANRALKETIGHMIEMGELAQVAKNQTQEWFKTSSAVYCLGDQWNDSDI